MHSWYILGHSNKKLSFPSFDEGNLDFHYYYPEYHYEYHYIPLMYDNYFAWQAAAVAW